MLRRAESLRDMTESTSTKKIPGRLIVDLLPDGKVRLVFLPSSGDEDATPVDAKDLNAAEFLFLNCGLSVKTAAALRAEINRNKVAGLDTSVSEDIAAWFRK
jgi:hypothetical protein